MNIMYRDTEVQVSADDSALQNAIDNCLPENRPYFEKVRDALSELKHFRELTGEANDISKKKRTESKILDKLEGDYYYTSHKFTEFCQDLWDEMDGKQREAFIAIAFVVPLAMLAMIIWGRAWWMLIFILVIVASVIGGYHLFKFIEKRQILSSMVPYREKIKELNEQQDAKDDEAKQSHLRYKALVKEFMDMDPAPQKPEEKISAANTPKQNGRLFSGRLNDLPLILTVCHHVEFSVIDVLFAASVAAGYPVMAGIELAVWRQTVCHGKACTGL